MDGFFDMLNGCIRMGKPKAQGQESSVDPDSFYRDSVISVYLFRWDNKGVLHGSILIQVGLYRFRLECVSFR